MKSVAALLTIVLSLICASNAQDRNSISKRLLPVVIIGRAAFIDLSGNVVITPEMNGSLMYSEGLAAVQIDGKWCYINENKDVVIKTEFDEVWPFEGGLARVMKAGKTREARPDERPGLHFEEEKLGFIDKSGKVIFEPQFDEFYGFNEGLGRVVIDDKWGFIDKKGNIVIKPQFKGAYGFSEGLANVLISNHGEEAYIDRTGKVVSDPSYKHFGSWFSNGLVSFFDGKKWGFADRNFKTVIAPQFDGVGPAFSEGLEAVKVGDLWGYIDTGGKIVIKPQFKHGAGTFGDGLAAVMVDGKIGYIGHDGKFVIPPQFTQAQDFYGGVAAVTSKVSTVHVNWFLRWDYIDRTGRYIWRSE